ncbi:pantoate--beta-alanine ligase [Peribacillus tepidiphilus]|uniref:pantoate--beta-alanine ligase n=1 Tax=Peribacillus tepidiphilus TaxID=2652445 RepID=UPI001291B57E|nr:pantoate--beta-alanine ligase [Peribacillus tepidiphilus]
MNIITSAKEMQSLVSEIRTSGKSIGFVPTMGYLHEGHQKLLNEARSHHDIVVLSIFVNPLQFGPNEDFDRYPRDIERDEKIAKEAGVDYIFYPTVQEMYPNDMSVKVMVTDRTDVLCGKSRPGHFDGVATVLTKLFHIVMPHKAYFGLKDAQQVAVVEGLVRDFNFPLEIVPVETVREEDGLAKSSRNVYLSEKERFEAKELYQSLLKGKELIENGEHNPAKVMEAVRKHIQEHTSGEIDYVEIYSYPELKKLEELKGKIILAIAVKFTKARLIDNVIINV